MLNYKNSGVDVQAGETAVQRIKPLVKKTYNKNVMSDLGVFGGFYNIDLSVWKNPVLVASTDGVGTKLLVAKMMNKFDTVGEDIVNHCVDDIFVHAAHPQFFLDYIGIGKMDSDKIEQILSGMTKACVENGMALIGGEMAEMPAVYSKDDFDIVGTIVGIVEKDKIINGETIVTGDVVLGYKSSGLHTNGYSLARKVLFEVLNLSVTDKIEGNSETIGELLLAVHKSYYKILKDYATPEIIHGMAHITGGGIKGNLKRIIPDGLKAVINYDSWETPILYKFMQKEGNISIESMLEAFNLGIGFMVVTDRKNANKLLKETEAIEIGFISETELNEKVEVIF